MPSKPIDIKVNTSALANQSHMAYPSPVSPTNTALSFCPTDYLSTYDLPKEFLLQYSLGQELGFGGFGFVFLTTRISDGAQLACKFIFKARVPRSSWIIDTALGHCPMEVAVLKNVKHENIIEFVDYFYDDTFCYCFTKIHGTAWSEDVAYDDINRSGSYVRRSAMDLFECIEKYEQFSEPNAQLIFSQIVEAVHYLHNMGLVHRDIKDENILIDDQFQVKLIDFGSAQFYDPTGNRQFDMFLGTKQYASPEILLQQSYRGPESEVWALGCCLYIILTGAVPFSCPNQAIRASFTFPHRKLSSSCLDLLSRMLEKNPARRITVKEILAHPWLRKY
ncbi:kinase-like protein [Globomyces pollinis-pini]|nr:kinase-like protein [Globomyces pollinis-pini]KAJ2999729.1 hypothetical protein HDV02_001972 [Globomyces sp. JEL0801]